jgi:hypothetical protein
VVMTIDEYKKFFNNKSKHTTNSIIYNIFLYIIKYIIHQMKKNFQNNESLDFIESFLLIIYFKFQ